MYPLINFTGCSTIADVAVILQRNLVNFNLSQSQLNIVLREFSD
jgi:hypothetical protein